MGENIKSFMSEGVMASSFHGKLRPTRWDALVAAAILLLAAACAAVFWRDRLSGDPTGLTAVVTIDGQEADRVALWPLREPERRSYTGQGFTLTVEFSPDGVRVAEADCPNLDCVHTGQVSGAGRSVVCLPARIAIQLTGDGGVDAVLG